MERGAETAQRQTTVVVDIAEPAAAGGRWFVWLAAKIGPAANAADVTSLRVEFDALALQQGIANRVR